MIHYLYLGHFQKEQGAMQFARAHGDHGPRPVLVRPLDPDAVRELLAQAGVEETRIPVDWGLDLENGYVVCDLHTRSRDAIEFLRALARRTGCDVFCDVLYPVAPDDITLTPG